MKKHPNIDERDITICVEQRKANKPGRVPDIFDLYSSFSTQDIFKIRTILTSSSSVIR